MSEGILYEKSGGIAQITLNRPEKMNAMIPSMTDRLEELSVEIQQDDEVGVLIVTGAGDQAFCAGGDLADSVPLVAEKGLAAVLKEPRRRFFAEVTKPIVAAINGICVAGGLELVLGADIRIAADSAVFGVPEVKWGLFPAGGGSVRLPRQIPWVRAMELLLIGGTMTAQEALAAGLLNRVVPQAEVMATARTFAEKIVRNGPVAARKIKESALRTHTLDWPDAFQAEYDLAADVFKTRDAREGLAAFAEKRKPVFTGR
ncbi:enoyl-CoA hydratase-related protein [Sphingomonas sp. YL-JM2C]